MALRQRRDPLRAGVSRGVAPLAVAAILLAGCTQPESAPPSTGSRTSAAAPTSAGPTSAGPVDCTTTAGSTDEVRQALDAAGPGSTICVTGAGLDGTDLAVTTSGTADRPVVLAGEGTTPVRSVTVRASHVVVEGFAATGGDGIVLSGTGLSVRGNRVERAGLDGISCEEACSDVVIEDNTVVGTDGSGILVEGDRILVRRNAVSGSVRRKASDADGIRFFGSDIQIRENTVSDIKQDGYPRGTEPHTDCFQTFDNGRLPTVDAVVADNVCTNVDAQCLIATAEEAGKEGDVGRSHGLEFTGNRCEVEGAQAVLVQWFPDVVVRGNSFDGPGLTRAAYYGNGSTGGEFTGNTVRAGVPPVEVEANSREGFTADVPN